MLLKAKVSYNAPMLIAAFSAFWFAFLTFSALYNNGLDFSQKLIGINIVFFLFWIGLLFTSKKYLTSFIDFFVSSILFVLIILLYSDAIYDNNYGLLNPFNEIMSNKLHVDLLFHSSIAESLRHYFTPSILQDGLVPLKYHYFSHAIVASFSKIFDLPALYVYNFIYPQFSVTVFLFVYIKLIHMISNYCSEKSFLYVKSLIPLLLYNVFIDYGTHVISQSHFVSMILTLSFVYIFIKYGLKYKIYTSFTFFVVAALFVFFISLSKISMGFVFTGGLLWYLFRENSLNLKNVVLYCLLLMCFILAYYVSHGSTAEDIGLELKINMPSVYFYIYSIPIVFLAYFIVRCSVTFKGLLVDVISKKLVLEESFFVMTFLCVFINLLLGSFGDYFILSASFVAVVMLSLTRYWFNILNVICTHLRGMKNSFDVCFLVLLVVFVGLYAAKSSLVLLSDYKQLKGQRVSQALLVPGEEYSSFEKYFSPNREYEKTSFCAIVEEINSISSGNKIDYAVFEEDPLFLRDIRHRVLSYVFMYSAFTGLVSYGNIYTDGKQIFMGNGIPYKPYGEPLFYGLTERNIMPKESRTLENIIKIAREDGKKFLFHIKNDKLHVIDLASE